MMGGVRRWIIPTPRWLPVHSRCWRVLNGSVCSAGRIEGLGRGVSVQKAGAVLGGQLALTVAQIGAEHSVE